MSLEAHLRTGVTTVCRCWALTRSDGRIHGFTDHDRDLVFEGTVFRADTGLTARAVQQSTGLSVDNSEAMGVLADPSVSEADIEAGRFDGAAVTAWTVNWADVTERRLTFRGTIGEISRSGGAFRAELRGQAEALNRPRGRVYQGRCGAILGDAACKVHLDDPAWRWETVPLAVNAERVLTLDGGAWPTGWFAHGALAILGGAAEGLTVAIKNDIATPQGRRIELWEAPRAPIAAGDPVRLTAGCDKRAETCRAKFDNFLNFRGFPHVPGEDWLMAFPRRGGRNDGGRL